MHTCKAIEKTTPIYFFLTSHNVHDRKTEQQSDKTREAVLFRINT